MSKTSEERGKEGEDFHEVEGEGREIQNMSVMLTVTNSEGESLPEGCLTVPNIARLFQERTAHLPYEVTVLNSRHALIDFEAGVPIMEVSRELHGATSWGELPVHIGCVVSGKASLINIFQEEEQRRRQKEEVDAQMLAIQREQDECRNQFAQVVQALQDKVKELEKKGQERVVPFPGTLGGT